MNATAKTGLVRFGTRGLKEAGEYNNIYWNAQNNLYVFIFTDIQSAYAWKTRLHALHDQQFNRDCERQQLE